MSYIQQPSQVYVYICIPIINVIRIFNLKLITGRSGRKKMLVPFDFVYSYIELKYEKRLYTLSVAEISNCCWVTFFSKCQSKIWSELWPTRFVYSLSGWVKRNRIVHSKQPWEQPWLLYGLWAEHSGVLQPRQVNINILAFCMTYVDLF